MRANRVGKNKTMQPSHPLEVLGEPDIAEDFPFWAMDLASSTGSCWSQQLRLRLQHDVSGTLNLQCLGPNEISSSFAIHSWLLLIAACFNRQIIIQSYIWSSTIWQRGFTMVNSTLRLIGQRVKGSPYVCGRFRPCRSLARRLWKQEPTKAIDVVVALSGHGHTKQKTVQELYKKRPLLKCRLSASLLIHNGFVQSSI